MADLDTSGKRERLLEFVRQLEAAPLVASFEDAFELICETLNRVEDAMTDIPYNPERWVTDGRMYPPQSDSMRSVAGRPRLKRFRSRGHNTFIGDNGSFKIQELSSDFVIISKLGNDGRGVDDI